MVGEIKIGVLIPQSRQYKTLDRDFVRGLKLNNLNAKLFVESIGIGADEQLIIEKIQKLNFQEGINIIIGFFGHNNISHVYEYASANDILVLATDLGATMPYSKKSFKGIYINSFALAESGYLLGKYFSEKNYNSIASATSYYDSGYGILSALESSLTENINFTGHYITPLNPREEEEKYMEAVIHNANPDAVFGFFSGLYAEETAAFISKNKLTAKYPFYFTAFSISDAFIEEYKSNPKPAYIVSPWLGSNDKNCEFTNRYLAAYSQTPSIFSLLGYESGLIVNHIITTAEQVENINSVIKIVEDIKIDGPRGTIKFEDNKTLFDHYIYTLEANNNNDSLTFKKIETLSNNGDFIKRNEAIQIPERLGGWHNAYLCH